MYLNYLNLSINNFLESEETNLVDSIFKPKNYHNIVSSIKDPFSLLVKVSEILSELSGFILQINSV